MTFMHAMKKTECELFDLAADWELKQIDSFNIFENPHGIEVAESDFKI